MYGLINKAIGEMVCSHFGEKAWDDIRRQAELEIREFVSMDTYPDDLTHRLVKAAGEVLQLSPAQVMHAFGEYWVEFVSKTGYEALMEMSGDTLPEFLHNLDDLHTRLGVSFPEFCPPAFQVDEPNEHTVNLHYHSEREGLAPMVMGLVKGLGDRFDTEVDVVHIQQKSEGADHDEFSIQYRENSACDINARDIDARDMNFNDVDEESKR